MVVSGLEGAGGTEGGDARTRSVLRDCRVSTRLVDDSSGRPLMREPGPRHAYDHSPGGVARRAAGTLEAEVLGILREASGPLSPGEGRQRVSARRRGEPPHSPILTIGSRLPGNGHAR